MQLSNFAVDGECVKYADKYVKNVKVQFKPIFIVKNVKKLQIWAKS